MSNSKGWTVAVPGRPFLRIRTLVCDFTGTLAQDGRLLPGVAVRLRQLARRGRVVVITAGTFGTERDALRGLPLELHFVRHGVEKARVASQLRLAPFVMIGNGRNDCAIMKRAALGIAVIGPEGCCAELLDAADLVVHDIRHALDLLANPLRATASLRP